MILRLHPLALGAGLIAGLYALVALLVGVELVASGPSPSSCAGSLQLGPAFVSSAALSEIPGRLLPLYERAAAAYRLGATGWAWLAAVNRLETDFGRDLSTSVTGAVGWMQFEPSTWTAYGVDADGDGRRDPYDPADAITAAARYLQTLGAPSDWERAIRAYNGGPGNAGSNATLAYWQSAAHAAGSYLAAGQAPIASPTPAGPVVPVPAATPNPVLQAGPGSVDSVSPIATAGASTAAPSPNAADPSAACPPCPAPDPSAGPDTLLPSVPSVGSVRSVGSVGSVGSVRSVAAVPSVRSVASEAPATSVAPVVPASGSGSAQPAATGLTLPEAGCAAAGALPLAPGDRAQIEPSGLAAAPATAPPEVRAMIAAGNQLIGRPYVYGGGHTDFRLAAGYDCSSSVSWALHGAGLLSSPEDSTTLEGFGEPGAGLWVTIFANPIHTFVYIAGIRLDTSPQAGDGRLSQLGPRWRPATRSIAGFVPRHPRGL